MGIRIYEQKANFHGTPIERLCIEGYERLSIVEETGEVAIFDGQPYASMFLTVNKVQPADRLKVNSGFDMYSEIAKMIWKDIEDEERTGKHERRKSNPKQRTNSERTPSNDKQGRKKIW